MDSNESPKDFPHKTFLNILRGPLELIDVRFRIVQLVDQDVFELLTDDFFRRQCHKLSGRIIAYLLGHRDCCT